MPTRRLVDGESFWIEIDYDALNNITQVRAVNEGARPVTVELSQISNGRAVPTFVAPAFTTITRNIGTGAGQRIRHLFDAERGRWDGISVSMGQEA